MTGADRRQLKILVDAARRRRVRLDDHIFGNTRCILCNGELDGWSLGCPRCSERHLRRYREGRYADPLGSAWYLRHRRAHMDNGMAKNREAQQRRQARARAAA